MRTVTGSPSARRLPGGHRAGEAAVRSALDPLHGEVPGAVRGPQHLLVELAGRRLRQLVHPRPPLGQLPAGELAHQTCPELLEGRRRTLDPDDDRAGPLAPALV